MHVYVCMYEYVYGPLQDVELDQTLWRKEKEKEKKREDKLLEKKEKWKK